MTQNPFVAQRNNPKGSHLFRPTGVTFRQDNLQKVEEGDLIIFLADPNNKYDKNAVQVIALRTEEQIPIGFVSKDHNVDMEPLEWCGYIREKFSFVPNSDKNRNEITQVKIALVDLTVPADD